jgi:integrase
MSLGTFPALLPADARSKAQAARDDLYRGINPYQNKISIKAERNKEIQEKILFEDFALDCIAKKRPEWRNQKHGDQWIYTIKNFAFPFIGKKLLKEIDTKDILNILNPIWQTKTHTANRLRGRLEWILASATTQGLRSGINPALWRGHLQTILSEPNKIARVKHHKALPFRAIPTFMAQLREEVTMASLALEFTILNASRSGEVLYGLRSEVNEEGLWTIPAIRMKAYMEHQVPLCNRSLELLSIAKFMEPESKYLFSRNNKPLSNMTMPKILKRMNIKATVHGFRSAFRDWVSEETNHNPDVVEMALAHAIKNKVEAAYRRGKLIEKRKLLMRDWASFCYSNLNANRTSKAQKADKQSP